MISNITCNRPHSLQEKSLPHGNIPEATDQYHLLMDTLRELQIYIDCSQIGNRPAFAIEMYDNIIRKSEFGRSCQYAIKTLSLFKVDGYKEVRDLILKLASIINEIEGTQ